MSRRRVFLTLRFFHMLIDQGLTSIFGIRFRHHYIRFSYRVKTWLFPEYGSYIPADAAITSPQQNKVLIPPPIPEWVLSEMKDLGRDIDPVLYPSDVFIASCQFYSFPIVPKPGHIYEQLIRQCTVEHYTHCFAIPWLKRGGADLVTLKHIEVANKQPGTKILVMLTEPGESPWRARVPKNVDILDISQHVSSISHEEILVVISRLLIQLRIDVLHIINSRHAWDVICNYGLPIHQRTKIFASIFCDDYDKYNQPVGFARQYLWRCYKYLTKVFSDNTTFPRLLCQTYGYDQELFSILKIPIEIAHNAVVSRNPVGRRVLWAGRLDRQKRPDLLLAIARSMPDVEFHVYGDTVLESLDKVISELKTLKNIVMEGAFDGVESLPFNEFPVFLYTSQWDGTPTIVIAAASASIPIVASCVGGVNDIVKESTGFPVRDIENVAEYVNNLHYVLENFHEAEMRAVAAMKYVENEHSQSEFEFSLLNTEGYFCPCEGTVNLIPN